MNDDGTVMRGPAVAAFAEQHKLKRISIADLIAYRQAREKLVERVGEFPVDDRDRPADAAMPMSRRSTRCITWRSFIGAHRRRQGRAGAAASRRRHPRRVRRRQDDARRAGALQAGRPRRDRLSARRHRRRAGDRHSAGRRQRDRSGALQPMARGRARRADPEGSRHVLDPAAVLQQAHLCRARRLRHRDHRHRERSRD